MFEAKFSLPVHVNKGEISDARTRIKHVGNVSKVIPSIWNISRTVAHLDISLANGVLGRVTEMT